VIGTPSRAKRAACRQGVLAASVGLVWLLGAARAPLVHAQEGSVRPAAPIDDATRAAVRRLGEAGLAAYQAEKYEEASERLEKAYGLMPVPSLALWSARALVARGLWTRGAERYLSARRLDLGPGDPQIQLSAQRMAAEERAALMPRIPSLRVVLSSAVASEVRISIDGAALPPLLVGEDWPVDPGEHVVIGIRGEERVEARSSVKEGEHAELMLHFVEQAELGPSLPAAGVSAAPAEPPAAPSVRGAESAPDAAPPPRGTEGAPWRGVGWVGIGVGGAALLTSGVLGLIAKDRGEALTSGPDCAGDFCLEKRRDDVESYNRLVDLSTVGWITGAALVGAGALLVLVVPGSEGSLGVALGPSAVRVSGQF
jgi:hypothetical protein